MYRLQSLWEKQCNNMPCSPLITLARPMEANDCSSFNWTQIIWALRFSVGKIPQKDGLSRYYQLRFTATPKEWIINQTYKLGWLCEQSSLKKTFAEVRFYTILKRFLNLKVNLNTGHPWHIYTHQAYNTWNTMFGLLTCTGKHPPGVSEVLSWRCLTKVQNSRWLIKLWAGFTAHAPVPLEVWA